MKTWILFLIVLVLLFFKMSEGMTVNGKPPTMADMNKALSDAIMSGRTQTATTNLRSPITGLTAPTGDIASPQTSTQAAPQKAQTITPAPFVSGNSTGGTSTSSLGPNSGATTNLGSKNVWGPEFTGVGMTMAGADQGDTTKSKRYPMLIGPKGSESTRIDGLGIIPPSKNYELANNGSLPTPESTGSAEGSQFLPNSRTPGDQDLIPDPYRVASAFTTSTYSSKTEPVPFLTDFSAFQK